MSYRGRPSLDGAVAFQRFSVIPWRSLLFDSTSLTGYHYFSPATVSVRACFGEKMKLDDTQLTLPPQQVTLDVLLEKYAKGDEKSVEEVRRRVARALAAVEKDPARWEPVFYEALENGFIPGGRVNSAAGTQLQATLINCFVQPVGDSVSETVDGKPGIYVALQEAAETMRRGGGVGYDFSAIRPKGARVRGTESTASGPVSYMRVFDKSCETVESAGSRRGAQMGILRCDHPDIEDFIHAKDHGRPQELQRERRGDRRLHARGRVRRRLGARAQVAARRRISRASAASAATGCGSTARSRRASCGSRSWSPPTITPSRACSSSTASTPTTTFPTSSASSRPIRAASSRCPRTAAAASAASISRCSCAMPFRPAARFDFEAFGKVVRPAVRMLDNVLDATVWPLPAAARGSARQAPRRAGLHRARRRAHHARAALRHRGSAPHGGDASPKRCATRPMPPRSSSRARKARFRCSTRSAISPRRASPRACPKTLKSEIRRHGIRNSHLLSIAPTGTISLAFADNASNGIEPRLLLDLPAQEAHARRLDEDLRRRGPRLAALPAPRRRRGEAAAAFRDRAGHLRARSHAHGRGGRAVRGFGDQQDRQRARGLSVRGLQGPLPRGVARRV